MHGCPIQTEWRSAGGTVPTWRPLRHRRHPLLRHPPLTGAGFQRASHHPPNRSTTMSQSSKPCLAAARPSQWHCCEGLGADRLFESMIGSSMRTHAKARHSPGPISLTRPEKRAPSMATKGLLGSRSVIRSHTFRPSGKPENQPAIGFGVPRGTFVGKMCH